MAGLNRMEGVQGEEGVKIGTVRQGCRDFQPWSRMSGQKSRHFSL